MGLNVRSKIGKLQGKKKEYKMLKLAIFLTLLLCVLFDCVSCSDIDHDSKSFCVFDYNYDCAAQEAIQFGLLALKILLSLITISCVIGWACSIAFVVWLQEKKWHQEQETRTRQLKFMTPWFCFMMNLIYVNIFLVYSFLSFVYP